MQAADGFGCSLIGCIDEVIHVVQRVSLKCFVEKGFCVSAQRSLDLFLISSTAVKISSCKWRMKFLSYANLLNNLEKIIIMVACSLTIYETSDCILNYLAVL